jgi:hypothetical protein
MKSIMLATVALFGFAGASAAFELGQTGVFFDNTTTATYSIEAGDLTATHEFNLNYDVNDKTTLYALTEINLADPKFAGLEVGVDYRVWAKGTNEVNLNGRVLTDNDFNYTDAIVELEVKF